MTQDWYHGKFLYRLKDKERYIPCPYDDVDTTNPYEHKLTNGIGVPCWNPIQTIFTIRNTISSKVLRYEIIENTLMLENEPIFHIARRVGDIDNLLDLEEPINKLVTAICTNQYKSYLPQPRKAVRMIYDIIECCFNPTLEYSLYGCELFEDEYLHYKEEIASKAIKLIQL